MDFVRAGDSGRMSINLPGPTRGLCRCIDPRDFGEESIGRIDLLVCVEILP